MGEQVLLVIVDYLTTLLNEYCCELMKDRLQNKRCSIWIAFTIGKKLYAKRERERKQRTLKVKGGREERENNSSVLNSANLIVTLKIKQPATAWQIM